MVCPACDSHTMTTAPSDQTVLFTAFEPSGDAHAAPVIAALRLAEPRVRIVAWGGPKMASAGAELMQQTADDGSMGLGALGKVRLVRDVRRAIRQWLGDHQVAVHVPVDSPAANFPIVKVTRAAGARTVHLVAPQLWAWAPWRIRKLRRLTDLVLCLLPFEADWFAQRGVAARFIGHPVMNRELDTATLDRAAATLPHGRSRIVILPGSRTQEVRANLSLLLRSFETFAQSHADAVGVIAAARESLRPMIVSTVQQMPEARRRLHVSVNDHDAAIHWADAALAVSGTVTLDLTRHAVPMVGVYRAGAPGVYASRFILTSPWRLLPNIIAGRQVAPEFVPYAGGPAPIAAALSALIDDELTYDAQHAALLDILAKYDGYEPDVDAAAWILRAMRGERFDTSLE